MDFIEMIEKKLGKNAIKNYLPMQLGDVPATWADCTKLHEITGYKPATSIQVGVSEFVDWFRDYYQR